MDSIKDGGEAVAIEDESSKEGAEPRSERITIFVNDKPVIFNSRLVSGSEIKTKAGVPLDSILYELRGNERIPIGDAERIKIHENERFLAVPGGTVSQVDIGKEVGGAT